MAARRKKAAYRQPPTMIELEAKRFRDSHQSVGDAKECPVELELALEVSERAEVIRDWWDETTEWLRARGITDRPDALPTRALIRLMEEESLNRHVPVVRIYPIDRPVFEFNEWLRGDFAENLPPDEYAEEVDRALQEYYRGRPIRKRPNDEGPKPSPHAQQVGYAMAWKEVGSWCYSRYRADAPLDALRAFEFSVVGKAILRIDTNESLQFVRGARRIVGFFPERPSKP